MRSKCCEMKGLKKLLSWVKMSTPILMNRLKVLIIKTLMDSKRCLNWEEAMQDDLLICLIEFLWLLLRWDSDSQVLILKIFLMLYLTSLLNDQISVLKFTSLLNQEILRSWLKWEGIILEKLTSVWLNEWEKGFLELHYPVTLLLDFVMKLKSNSKILWVWLRKFSMKMLIYLPIL